MTNESMTNLLLQWYEKNGKGTTLEGKGRTAP